MNVTGNLFEVLEKLKDDFDFESSPCACCKLRIYWGFKFCIYCGEVNNNYDPAFDDLEEDCSKSHQELNEPDQTIPVIYCSGCGVLIRS